MKFIQKLYIFISSVFVLFAVIGCQKIQDNHNHHNHNIYASESGYVAIQEGELFYSRFGKGNPIIVVHGGPGSDYRSLLPQMLELAKDYEVIFYDQRGSGNSLKSSIEPKYINSEQFVQDLERLRLKLGLNKITLLGHSWGGFLSMNYAIKYPDNISSLIIVSSLPADYKERKVFLNEFRKRTKNIKDKINPLFNYKTLSALSKKQINHGYRYLFSVYFANSANVDKLTLDRSKESAIGGSKVFALMSDIIYFTPDYNLTPDLGMLKVPTLIIHGKQDIISVDTAIVTEKAIPGAKAIYLDDCGHYPYIERPNEFFSSIRSFLSRPDRH